MVNQYRRHSTDHPLDERVAILLEAASAPTEPGPLPGEDEAMAAFRASHESSRRSSMLSSLKSTKAAAAAALSVGVMLTGGAAVAGTQPGAAQETAHSVLAELGIEVPGSDGNHAEPADTRGASGEEEVVEISDEEAAGVSGEEETLDTAENGDGDEVGAQGEHGALVSGFATSTELRGAEKGAAIAAMASEGKSKAGENPSEERSAGRAGGDRDEAEGEGSRGAPEESERGRSADAPPVETPNKGAASEDAPPAETPNNGGPENGDDASGGKSSGGSENGGRP